MLPVVAGARKSDGGAGAVIMHALNIGSAGNGNAAWRPTPTAIDATTGLPPIAQPYLATKVI